MKVFDTAAPRLFVQVTHVLFKSLGIVILRLDEMDCSDFIICASVALPFGKLTSFPTPGLSTPWQNSIAALCPTWLKLVQLRDWELLAWHVKKIFSPGQTVLYSSTEVKI